MPTTRGVLPSTKRTTRNRVGFLGITDVRFVRAEGVAMGDAKKAEDLAEAANGIAKLVA
jgi:FMN-dependent NADH-azoreductase